jgi:hypothetical protein
MILIHLNYNLNTQNKLYWSLYKQDKRKDKCLLKKMIIWILKAFLKQKQICLRFQNSMDPEWDKQHRLKQSNSHKKLQLFQI